MNKKGQLQIQESIIVIFLVMIIIIIGMIFFFKVSSKSIDTDSYAYEEFRFHQMIEVVPNMAEFKCSHLGVEEECLDWLKVRSFTSLGLGEDYPVFKDKSIILKKDGVENLIYFDAECLDARIISSPVSLYDPLLDRYSVAELIVRWCS